VLDFSFGLLFRGCINNLSHLFKYGRDTPYSKIYVTLLNQNNRKYHPS
jgi:hypothetical protein